MERVLVPTLFLIVGFCLGCGEGRTPETPETPKESRPEESFLLKVDEWPEALKPEGEWTPEEKKELNQALSPDGFERLEGMYRWKGRRPERE